MFSTKEVYPLVVLAVLCFLHSAECYLVSPLRPSSIKATTATATAKRLTTTRLQSSPLESASTLLPALLRSVSKTEAQGSFYFFFLAGSGALGIGFAQVPKLLTEYGAIAALAGRGISRGGEPLKLDPLSKFGYPGEFSRADILNIIDNIPSVDDISKKGPKKSYMAQRGYLERQGFVECYPPEENQLALYIVFDALTGGGSSSVAPPDAVEQATARWKSESPSLDSFTSDLLKAQFGKLSGFAGLAFLIALVIDLIVESGITAFGN